MVYNINNNIDSTEVLERDMYGNVINLVPNKIHDTQTFMVVEELPKETPEKITRQKRTFKEHYDQLATQEYKNNFVYRKLYQPLSLLELSKEETVALLYGLGGAIASGVYPPTVKKKSDKIKKKILAQTKNMTQEELDKLFDEIVLQLNGETEKEETASSGDPEAVVE